MSSDKKTSLTSRELELAGLIWQCFESEPKINYQKLKDLAGFKNANSASACWNPIKKKLMANAGAATNNDGATPKVKTPAKRKSTATANGEEETPSKKSRSKKQPAKAPNEDGDVDDDFKAIFKREEAEEDGDAMEQDLMAAA
ncbi:hypothetical protein BJ170DRAFT_693065 [Xylariales sp. AK1849]|nr:hypothetical protein BJ170DRAFT_693065 [Xylariales sp. AK1849]